LRNFFYFIAKHATFIYFLILESICLALLFNFNDYQRSSFFSSSNRVCASVYSIGNSITQYFGLRRENLRLAEENARLNNKIDQLQQQLLAITDTMPRKLVIDNDRYFIYTSGNIINSSTNRSRNFLTADVGTKSGITDNMIVVNEDGVIGMVTATSKHFCTILPIINNASRLSAKIKKSGFHGQIVWNEVSYRRAIMEDVPEHAVVAVGDSIVTSGSSSYYPENLYIGKISEIEMDRNGGFYRLIIELAVDYNSVSQVKFIRNKRADEQRALEEGQQ